MARMAIRLLAASLLVLGCAYTQRPAAASSASLTCPDKDGRGPQSASVTCRVGFLPDCTGCSASGAPTCRCVPETK
jgi:hypothetical protein